MAELIKKNGKTFKKYKKKNGEEVEQEIPKATFGVTKNQNTNYDAVNLARAKQGLPLLTPQQIDAARKTGIPANYSSGTTPLNNQTQTTQGQQNQPLQSFEQIQKTASGNLPLTPEQRVNFDVISQSEANQKANEAMFGGDSTAGERVTSAFGAIGSNLATFTQATAQQAAGIGGSIRAVLSALTGLGSRDTANVKAARDNFDLLNGYLDESINQVAMGGNADLALKDIIDAESSLQTMEREIQGKSIRNLNYWLLGGADTQREVDINRRILLDKYNKLIMAQQQNAQNQQQARLNSQMLNSIGVQQ